MNGWIAAGLGLFVGVVITGLLFVWMLYAVEDLFDFPHMDTGDGLDGGGYQPLPVPEDAEILPPPRNPSGKPEGPKNSYLPSI